MSNEMIVIDCIMIINEYNYSIKLPFNFVSLIYIGDKQELTEEDVEIIHEVLNNFTEDEVDPTLI